MKTSLFKYFKKMPKGVLNHIHFPAFNSTQDWLDIFKRDVTIKDMINNSYSFKPKEAKLDKGFERY